MTYAADLEDGRRHLQTRDWEASEAAYSRVLRSPKFGADGYYGLALNQFGRGSAGEARKLLLKAIDANPKHANSLFYLAASSTSRDEAHDLYVRVLDLNPNHQGAKARLAELVRPVPADPRAQPPVASAAVAPQSQAPATIGTDPISSDAVRRGLVSQLRARTEPRGPTRRSATVINFRLCPDDPTKRAVQVEMRSRAQIRGMVMQGDVVELTAVHEKHGVLMVREINNLTGNVQIRLVPNYTISGLLYILGVLVSLLSIGVLLDLLSRRPLGQSWDMVTITAVCVASTGMFRLIRNRDRLGPSASISGRVSGFRTRSEMVLRAAPHQVWNFRLEGVDNAGKPTSRASVEFRSNTGFEGDVWDGDEVEVVGHVREGLMLAQEIRNTTTAATVRPLPLHSRTSKRIFLALLATSVLVLILFW